jgi:diguanylate cyclase (GGDEF)-like protein/PAS domain S-box-containing protein
MRGGASAATDEAGFRQLVEQLPDVVARFDAALRFAYVNPAIETLTGLPREAFLGRTARELLLPRSVVDDWDDAIRSVFDGGEAIEWRFPYETPDCRRWFHCLAIPERDEHGALRYACMLTRDITKLKELEDRLELEASRDPVTGLATRGHFERIAEPAAAAGTVGVCLVDLDDFKAVNDAHGHHVGDAVLEAIGSRLHHLVRPGDVVARYGGDEFTILAAGVAEEADLEGLATRIVEALGEPYAIEGLTLSVTASVGVAMGDGHLGALLRRADVALYQSKRDGKSSWAFNRGPSDVRGPTRA